MKVADYPHANPDTNDFPWIDITLYSITGWFAQLFNDSQISAVAFGGYMKVAADDGSLIGMLIDTAGGSEISGFLSEENLLFSKRYFFPHITKGSIEYEFKKGKNGLWEGIYIVEGYSVDDDRVVCKLSPVIENAFGIVAGKTEVIPPF